LSDVAGTLVFSANDGIHGNELWKATVAAVGFAGPRDIIFAEHSDSAAKPMLVARGVGDTLVSSTGSADRLQGHGGEDSVVEDKDIEPSVTALNSIIAAWTRTNLDCVPRAVSALSAVNFDTSSTMG